jgi:multidrug efflux pump subunit AcrB
MIGIVALLGIVVNDAIVLIDKINNNRKFNLPLPDAIEQGCKQRLQPVIITTMTTALGMIPLIFSGNTFRDLAIVVAVGITVATVFTLVMVPIFYMALESRPLAKLFTFIKGRIRG